MHTTRTLLCVVVVSLAFPSVGNEYDVSFPGEDEEAYSVIGEDSQDLSELDLGGQDAGDLIIEELDLEETGTRCIIPKSRLITRWFWWVLICFMFYAQATVCDEYFITTIVEVCDRYGVPGDVAGATLMALGCNGPELFTNFISIFITHTDVGVGTIVGSEMFNILCIVGGSIMCVPDPPLVIETVPFCRDSFFYGLSVVMLYWVLYDGIVSLAEAYTLMLGCISFALTVTMTQRMVKCFREKVMHEEYVKVESEKTQNPVHDISGPRLVIQEIKHELETKEKHFIIRAFLVIASPIPLALAATVGWCDVRVPSKKKLWPLCFFMSMCWLAVFSYLMCFAANELHLGFCFSNAILGITICAIGTSFPNFYASLQMARRGCAGMAIANALGSNVQNIFLALAFPWCARTTAFMDIPFKVKANGIFSGVIWMMTTLAVVLITSLIVRIRFPIWAGIVFVITYLIYLYCAIFV